MGHRAYAGRRAKRDPMKGPADFRGPAREMLLSDPGLCDTSGLRFFPYTDSGNAERLAHKFRGSIRYCAPHRTWYLWTGRRWEPDQIGEMLQRTKQIARELYEEAAKIEDEANRKHCAEWARKCESSERRKAALFLSQYEPGIPVLPAEFDGDPFLLNCTNGTVDLRTGILREHNAEEMITRLAPAEYDSAARSELWELFLDQSTGGSRELRDFSSGPPDTV